MRWSVRGGATSLAALLAAGTLAGGSTVPLGPAPIARADPGDAPVYTPTIAWESPVSCGTCSIDFHEGAVLVFEQGDSGHLRSFQLADGTERWSAPTSSAGELTVTQYALVVHDKERYRVIDPLTGTTVVERDGIVIEVNTYGVLIADEPTGITAVDVRTGEVLWVEDDPTLAVADVCRDIVILVDRTGAAPFSVRDQRTGDQRWRSDAVVDRSTDDLTCGGWWIYVADGAALTAFDAAYGYEFFTVDVDGGDSIELYREVALVFLDDGSGEVVAVDRFDGFVVWRRPAADVGELVSTMGRLRSDGSGLVTVHAMTGEIVNHLASPTTGTLTVVGVSETRVTVASATSVAAYGLADLGPAWEFDLGEPADDLGVADEVLVARFGDRLVAYR